MRRTRRALRGPRNVALLSLGALAVHQTTYLLAADADLHAISEHTRHSYLAELNAAALLAVYLGQELGEALLVGGGHASVLEATLGGGAWLALPLALAFGALGAAVAGLLDRAEARLARACPARSERAPRSTGSAVAGAPPARELTARLRSLPAPAA